MKNRHEKSALISIFEPSRGGPIAPGYLFPILPWSLPDYWCCNTSSSGHMLLEVYWI